MRRTYKIHPGIGIARVGNSTSDWFDGPETPDLKFVPEPDGKYRDADNRIRRQATRFRIYEYSYDSTDRVTDVREVTGNDAEIHWHVTLANLKSFTRSSGVEQPVPNTPPTATVAGSERKEIIGRIFDQNVQLGTLISDDSTLRVLGGFGVAGSRAGAPSGSGLFWEDWFDDVSDGPVRATIRLRNTGEMPAVESAWVVTGVPAFAHPVIGIVSMFDLAYSIAVESLGLTPPREVSFTRDIYPLLQRPVLMQWVDGTARSGHGNGAVADFLKPTYFALLSDNDSTPGSSARNAREAVFAQLKSPTGGGGDMPRLIGLTVTPFQYEQLRSWSRGDFLPDWTGVPASPPPFNSLTPMQQVESLDKTGLWTGVGGAFSPGIEVGERFGEASTYESPFRIRQTLPAGYLTQTLSVPWQVDYSACGRGWWPSGRPNDVSETGAAFDRWARFTGSDTMLTSWWKLGFLAERTLPDGRIGYLQTERV